MSGDLLRGLLRLGAVILAMAAVSVLLGLGFLAAGGTGRSAMAAGTGVVGVMLILAGVATAGRTGALASARRRAARAGSPHPVDPAESGNLEPLALGLIALGFGFSAVSLTIG